MSHPNSFRPYTAPSVQQQWPNNISLSSSAFSEYGDDEEDGDIDDSVTTSSYTRSRTPQRTYTTDDAFPWRAIGIAVLLTISAIAVIIAGLELGGMMSSSIVPWWAMVVVAVLCGAAVFYCVRTSTYCGGKQDDDGDEQAL